MWHLSDSNYQCKKEKIKVSNKRAMVKQFSADNRQVTHT